MQSYRGRTTPSKAQWGGGGGAVPLTRHALPHRAACPFHLHTPRPACPLQHTWPGAYVTGTAASTGTTPTTTQSGELWLGGIGFANTNSFSSVLNGFTDVFSQSSSYPATNGTDQTTLHLLEKFVTSTGTASSGGTISANGGRVVLDAKAIKGLFDKAINIEGEQNATAVVKSDDGMIEFVAQGDIVNKGAVQADRGKNGVCPFLGHFRAEHFTATAPAERDFSPELRCRAGKTHSR